MAESYSDSRFEWSYDRVPSHHQDHKFDQLSEAPPTASPGQQTKYKRMLIRMMLQLVSNMSRAWVILGLATVLFFIPFTAIVAIKLRHASPRFSAMYVPITTPVVRTFEDTFSFGGGRTNRTDRNWNSLIPYGGGFVPVSDPAAWGLPRDERQEDDQQLWGVSVFHQLHCLSLLRIVHFNFVAGTPSDEETVTHSAHCFDFLRQAISCFGDTTLEMPQLRTEATIDRATWSSPRQCRDFESIREWTETAYRGTMG